MGKKTRMTGAKALIESLYAEKVEIIFGYPGGVLLPIYDELFDADINHILVRHEQAAAHAADGYARATGKVGVCLATSGPGATNLVTGIATAYMDSIPMVAITGQVPSNMIGNDAFQEANITGITLPITKHNYLVTDVNDLPRIIKEAFHIASTGRPGPVLIDIPKDITTDELDFEYPETVELRGYKPTKTGHKKQVKRAANVISKAKQPVLYVGGGIIAAGATKELLALAQTINAPVTTTLMGKGAFPDENPLCLGMPGMHGTKYANYAIQESDVLIAVGVRFDDRVTGKIESFAPNAQVIHIDIDPAEISKNVRVDIPIVGDSKSVL
ncbi:MAG: biosynthetic-type acetolactate synthase large subunit, partial [Methanosarcinales archaeon]|nr:biosynthetic-type acetolactate synthase large subunit [Methanosarcinales archaeon]